MKLISELRRRNVIRMAGLHLVGGRCRAFDLEAAPNFKARLAESGLRWPPSPAIEAPPAQ